VVGRLLGDREDRAEEGHDGQPQRVLLHGVG
jgi:hypothetical protein